jgi:hypothetical protein
MLCGLPSTLSSRLWQRRHNAKRILVEKFVKLSKNLAWARAYARQAR